MLYPEMTSGRLVFDLSGIWDFRLIKKERGNTEEKEERELGGRARAEEAARPLRDSRPMPVPSSYNDIYPGRGFADHVGEMVYQRMFTVTEAMKRGRLVLRFGAVTHGAQVYLNGKLAGSHRGGFLPFSFEIGEQTVVGENLLTVYVDNVVDYTTLPCGRLETQKIPGRPDRTVNLPNFDFYNYTGIMRPVWLYTTPDTYVRDIEVSGKMDGTFCWKADIGRRDGVPAPARVETEVSVLDADGNLVFTGQGEEGTGKVENIRLWSTDAPNLYRLKVRVKAVSSCTDSAEDAAIDEYTETFGFREVSIQGCRILLNGEPVYLKGFGKHEEGITRGRGTDTALMTKDLALLKWINANSFRTSHYPNSEEMMRLCDRLGILVIDEAPAVGLNTGFTATGLLGGDADGTWKTVATQEHHRDVMEELVRRDKNHPCVIAWSVANEPASQEEGAREYFAPLIELTKRMDPQSRPVTVVTYEGADAETCRVSELCDFLMLNRYRGWYDTEGDLEGAAAKLKNELEAFHRRYPRKPVMLGEYGADTIAGFHDLNARLFTEEYQTEFMKAYGKVFDSLDFITGEHVWVFADFATAENVKRVDGNKKGIFTRVRRPKQAAFFLKERWKEK